MCACMCCVSNFMYMYVCACMYPRLHGTGKTCICNLAFQAQAPVHVFKGGVHAYEHVHRKFGQSQDTAWLYQPNDQFHVTSSLTGMYAPMCVSAVTDCRGKFLNVVKHIYIYIYIYIW